MPIDNRQLSLFNNLADNMAEAGRTLATSDSIAARRLRATLAHLEEACLAILPPVQDIHGNLLSRAIGTRSMRIISLMPETPYISHRINSADLAQLLSWIEPHELRICARRGLCLPTNFSALLAYTKDQPEYAQVFHEEFLDKTLIRDHRSRTVWHNSTLYSFGCPGQIAEALRYCVKHHPGEMQRVLTDLLTTGQSVVPPLALILAGVKVVMPQLRAKASDEVVHLHMDLLSAHGTMHIHSRHGSLEDYLASLPREIALPVSHDGWRMPPLNTEFEETGFEGLVAVEGTSILGRHDGTMDDDLLDILLNPETP
jgi:hypothetical protein